MVLLLLYSIIYIPKSHFTFWSLAVYTVNDEIHLKGGGMANRRVEVKENEIHNNLMILKEIETVKGEYGQVFRMFLCRCLLCGVEFEAKLSAIRSGNKKQCRECGKRVSSIKVTPGEEFSSLTAIKELEVRTDEYGNRCRMVLCLCTCGEIQSFRLGGLTSGNSRWCTKCSIIDRINKRKNIKKGEIFGDLTAIGEVEGERKRGGGLIRKAQCYCVCGEIQDFDLLRLLSGQIKRCRKCFETERRNYRISKGFDPDYPMADVNQLGRGIFAGALRDRILKRDNSLCQMCCEKTADEVHHIIPWSECRELKHQHLRYEPKNCISLCKECHFKAHDGNYRRIDKDIAEQLSTKAISNTENYHGNLKIYRHRALQSLKKLVFSLPEEEKIRLLYCSDDT